MNYLDWILHPALQFGLLALLAVGLYLNLFFTLKRDSRVLESRRQKSQGEIDAALDDLRGALDGVSRELREMAETAGMLVVPTPPRSGLNLNKRGLALRMYRRGDSPDQIARTLELPKGEVELLLKVHRILVQKF
ncbi:MAG: DUF2802 domain-containing protein [Acidobacteria bacterium]|nr:DUF2802 domain-containing protein [Acidobacteriota bacterium]